MKMSSSYERLEGDNGDKEELDDISIQSTEAATLSDFYSGQHNVDVPPKCGSSEPLFPVSLFSELLLFL